MLQQPIGPATPAARSSARTYAFVFLFTAAIFLATAAYSSVSGDVWTANVASWQLANHGNLWLDQINMPTLTEHTERDIWIMRLDSGHEVIGRSPGAVVAALPAYALFGSGAFSFAPGAATAAVLTAVSATLVLATLKDRMPQRQAVLAALTFGLATPVWSVAANGMWPHTITVLGICGMAWAASTERWWLVGLFGGVALWGRLHVAVVVAVLGLLIGWRRRDAALTLRIATPSALLLVLQCVWTKWLYESWNPMSSYDTKPFESFASEHRIDLINHLGFWVSPDRGMLVWTPLILVLVPATVRHWRQLPDWSTALVWAGLAYTLLQGTLNRFSGGDTFYGYRLTLELLACMTPTFALAAGHMGRRARILFPYVLALQAAAILPGAVNGGLGTVAERVWKENSLVTAFEPNPVLGLVAVVIVLLIAHLGARIWADPGIRTKTPTERVGSTL